MRRRVRDKAVPRVVRAVRADDDDDGALAVAEAHVTLYHRRDARAELAFLGAFDRAAATPPTLARSLGQLWRDATEMQAEAG